SVAGALRGLSLDGLADPLQVREAIPVKVTTLHRLFGSRADTRGFHHDGGNLLPLDVLVIDEASMVDLEMMAAVFAALAPGARLVLLGDKDQLASVEAGAVLGKLCRRAGAGHYTERTREWIKEICAEEIDPSLVDNAGSPLDQAVAMLRVSHRFAADSGIGQLASSVNSGDFAAVEQILQAPSADLARISLAAASPDRL
ncbi:MAG: AAA family ATPase, partial [Candidatus Competibacteraceae bacterium]|nr:AAA family ATPase [Candidatus Competibacteraceae bacterium]